VCHDEFAAVQNVMTHETVQELQRLLSEFGRLPFECSPTFGKAVSHLNIVTAKLPDQLHIVVAGNAKRRAGLRHRHDKPQNFYYVRTAVDKIADEHDLSAIRWRRAVLIQVSRDHVTQPL
jgi:hypothetical protein